MSKEYYQQHRAKCLEYSKRYRTEHLDHYKEYGRCYYSNNRKRIDEQHRQYRVRRGTVPITAARKEYMRHYRDENKGRINESRRKYIATHPEKLNQWNENRRGKGGAKAIKRASLWAAKFPDRRRRILNLYSQRHRQQIRETGLLQHHFHVGLCKATQQQKIFVRTKRLLRHKERQVNLNYPELFDRIVKDDNTVTQEIFA